MESPAGPITENLVVLSMLAHHWSTQRGTKYIVTLNRLVTHASRLNNHRTKAQRDALQGGDGIINVDKSGRTFPLAFNSEAPICLGSCNSFPWVGSQRWGHLRCWRCTERCILLGGWAMWENWRFEEVKKMVCAPSSTPPKWRLAGGHHRWWTRTGTQPAKPSAGKVVLQVCGKAGRSTFTSRVPVARPRPIGR